MVCPYAGTFGEINKRITNLQPDELQENMFTRMGSDMRTIQMKSCTTHGIL